MSDILDLSFEKRIYVHIKKMQKKKKRKREIECEKTTLLLLIDTCCFLLLIIAKILCKIKNIVSLKIETSFIIITCIAESNYISLEMRSLFSHLILNLPVLRCSSVLELGAGSHKCH